MSHHHWHKGRRLKIPVTSMGARTHAAGALATDRRQRLHALSETINSLHLRGDIDAALVILWRFVACDPVQWCLPFTIACREP